MTLAALPGGPKGPRRMQLEKKDGTVTASRSPRGGARPAIVPLRGYRSVNPPNASRGSSPEYVIGSPLPLRWYPRLGPSLVFRGGQFLREFRAETTPRPWLVTGGIDQNGAPKPALAGATYFHLVPVA